MQSSLLILANLFFIALSLPHISFATDLVQEFLHLQNEVREQVDVPPLKWDTKLADYAQAYAHERASDCQLIHSHGPYGENIYWGYGEGYTDTKAAVDWWAGEKEYYDYDSNTCDPSQECLHYTQMVWRNTERVGCATVTCDNSNTFITCNYDPPGNVIGEKPY